MLPAHVCALGGAAARRYAEEDIDEDDARNPLPDEYDPEEHLVYLVYDKFKTRSTDVGFFDTRWVALEEMLEELGAEAVEPDLDIFEATINEARVAALQADA